MKKQSVFGKKNGYLETMAMKQPWLLNMWLRKHPAFAFLKNILELSDGTLLILSVRDQAMRTLPGSYDIMCY